MKNLAVLVALIGSSAAVSRRHMIRHNNLLALGDLYSNELANGDKSDDKELEKEYLSNRPPKSSVRSRREENIQNFQRKKCRVLSYQYFVTAK